MTPQLIEGVLTLRRALTRDMREMSITGWHKWSCPTMEDMDNECSPLCAHAREALKATDALVPPEARQELSSPAV
jgi:hypothetical protein